MRFFKPEADQLLYHYCSAQTLMAILGSQKIRFSDINMMNDGQEMRWGYSVFEASATQFLRRQRVPESVPDIPKQFFDDVDEVVHRAQVIAHPFVACFSLEPDSLEQWRAYGDDGRDFAIALRVDKLKELPVTMFEVLYDWEEQVKEMMAVLLMLYTDFYSVTDDREQFRLHCADLGVMLAGYKHPAFKAEREVRCVHAIELEKTPKGGRQFRDPGGTSGAKEILGETVGFYVRDGHLTAYVDLPMQPTDGESPVGAVITGPKNYSHTGNLLLYLASVGLDDIKFGHSAIPYR